MNTVLDLASEAVYVLADEQTKGPEFGKASPVGLLVIVVLLVATFLLIRSMNRQLRKLPDSFDTANPEPDQAFDEGTDVVDDESADGERRTHGSGEASASAGGTAPSDHSDDRGR
ncbi:hypothetical protein [Gordonia sp. (in: high G+C Gram-positive bacteria)]|uniref:hypothetical protein n=1 Tax=Gordonia sp. (in: high G+C Gram-positive bacteria) TaxID=84139 RepID=UPI0025BD6738|nr:hypothetical protein [Gordonia sp. (in: high G+C Gram-positive bacteria)]